MDPRTAATTTTGSCCAQCCCLLDHLGCSVHTSGLDWRWGLQGCRICNSKHHRLLPQSVVMRRGQLNHVTTEEDFGVQDFRNVVCGDDCPPNASRTRIKRFFGEAGYGPMTSTERLWHWSGRRSACLYWLLPLNLVHCWHKRSYLATSAVSEGQYYLFRIARSVCSSPGVRLYRGHGTF